MRCLSAILVLCATCTPSAAEVRIERNVRAADPISNVCLNPWKGDFKQPDEVGMPARAVSIQNAFKNNLRGWFISAPGAKQTILFCMGNSGNISLMLPYAKILHDGGFNVLLFDYQGFGNSEGSAALNSLLTDALAAHDFLTQEKRIAPENIGVFGVSLGSVLALRVAVEREVGAVAVEDVFIPDDLLNRWQDQLTGGNPLAKIGLQSLKTLLVSRVDPLKTIKQLKVPLFLFHGENDRLLPPVATLKLAQMYDGPKRVWLMPDTGHAPESLEINDLEYASQIQSYFRSALQTRLQEPKLAVRTSKIDNRFRVAATVTVADAHASPVPVQIALSNGEQFHFERAAVAGTRVVVIDCPFSPDYSNVVRIQHAHVVDGKQWAPDLSPFSQALTTYRNVAFKMFRGEENHANMVNGSYYSMLNLQFARLPFPAEEASALLKSRPDSQAPVRIRARYARLYARLYHWPTGKEARPSLLQEQCGEAMLDCFPNRPEDYFEVGNAMFELEFRDPFVAEALFRLALEKFRARKAELARAMLFKYRAIHGANFQKLSPNRIRQIKSAAELLAAVGKSK